MAKTKVKLIKGDQRTLEHEVWSKWIDTVAKLFDRHISAWPEDDPLAYNETASVAFLAAAGSVAGYVTLAECKTDKLDSTEADSAKLERRKRQGRADLWLHSTKRYWAFEFKQRLGVGVSRANGRLASWMKLAEKCALDIDDEEDGKPVAGLILPLYFIEDDEKSDRASEEIKAFASKEADYCWLISPPHQRRPTYILFKFVEK